jgi:hypothetical protein
MLKEGRYKMDLTGFFIFSTDNPKHTPKKDKHAVLGYLMENSEVMYKTSGVFGGKEEVTYMAKFKGEAMFYRIKDVILEDLGQEAFLEVTQTKVIFHTLGNSDFFLRKEEISVSDTRDHVKLPDGRSLHFVMEVSL